ncbi:MAG: Nramp family divalent metal transporter [bacterium]
MDTNAQTHATAYLDGNALRVGVRRKGWVRRFLAFVGPAYLVSIGYMDPGNWATDIEAGSRFGYSLLWVILIANLMAILLQTLAARLGIVTGRDLAQVCRASYPRSATWMLWVFSEIAIAATDLAAVLGTIIGLNLLFGLPLLWGCLVAVLDTFLLLLIQRFGVRKMEAFILMMVGVIAIGFCIEVIIAKPAWGAVAQGFVPGLPIGAILVAVSIVGATIMPHNLYLHSALVQSRLIADTQTGRREACHFNLIDAVIALNGAFFVNAAILITAAAVFYRHGLAVTELQQAGRLLEGLLGSRVAPAAFGIALLAASQSSTLTGTISGQVVMEGFINIRLRPWLRRMITRSMALLPAVIVILIAGDHGLYRLLIISQVVLCLQLPFAVVPLVQFTSDRRKMGDFVNRFWVRLLAWTCTGIIVALNAKLVADTVAELLRGAPWWAWAPVTLVALSVTAGLIALIVLPLVRPGPVWPSGLATLSRSVSAALRLPSVRHLAVALEHSPGDALILGTAVRMAKAHAAKLTLLHAVVTPGTMLYGSDSRSLHSDEDQSYLEQLAREIEDHDLSVETQLLYGDPVKALINAVHENDFDMLVLGAHGHRGLQDLLLGQTVTPVRHAIAIPLVIVPTRGSESAQRE